MKNIIMLSFLLFSSCFASDIFGFRDIHWGDKLYRLGQIENPEKYQKHGKSFVTKKNDYLKIGDANLQNITYGFCDDKFCYVECKFYGDENFNKILPVVEEKYGKMQKKAEYDYFLRKDNVVIGLKYNYLVIINIDLYKNGVNDL